MPLREKTIHFLDENARRNAREWFAAHKDQYREFVKTPHAGGGTAPHAV